MRLWSKTSLISHVRADDEMEVARIAPAPGHLLSISSEIWNGKVRSFRLSYAEMSIAPQRLHECRALIDATNHQGLFMTARFSSFLLFRRRLLAATSVVTAIALTQ